MVGGLDRCPSSLTPRWWDGTTHSMLRRRHRVQLLESSGKMQRDLILRHPEQARLSAKGVNCSLGMTSHFAGGIVGSYKVGCAADSIDLDTDAESAEHETRFLLGPISVRSSDGCSVHKLRKLVMRYQEREGDKRKMDRTRIEAER